ncbi:MAG: Rrf2 family transcriptional regulator [Bacteroidetes bacterium]|nr:Rrf2 family transcriptional regulator [Bacteroidota bacterium]
MFSRACEYGIRACIHLAQISKEGGRSSLKAIAAAIDSPVAFTAKILQTLAREEIIVSVKGPNGGYEVEASRLDVITLDDIVDAIDGNSIYRGCGLGLKHCNAKKPCPLHFQFKKIRDELKEMLQSTSLNDVATGLHEGLAFLKR